MEATTRVNSQSPFQIDNMEKQILIIGAGASGIAAATKLLENGFQNITILEAESRIGGRINTVPYGTGFIDMGAQWCHGQTGNVVYELAKDHDLLEPSTALRMDSINLFQSDGTEISRELNDKLIKLMVVLDTESEECNGVGSHGVAVELRYAEILKTEEFIDIDSAIAAQFLQVVHRYHQGMNATDSWFDASCPGYVESLDAEGDQLLNWKGKGYRTVLDLLMKKIPDPSAALAIDSKIVLNKKVKVIRWSTDTGKTVVECEEGNSYEADHVICTVSLGVLQAHQSTLFSPELPFSKRNVIDGFKLGTVNKIYIEFDEPFWSENWAGFVCLWCDDDLAEIRANPDEKWMEAVSNFSTVQYHSNLLCGWLSGPLSREMETKPESVVSQVVTKWIGRFLLNKMVREPSVAIKRSTWNSEPNFRGSYSYKSVHGDELGSTRSDLAAPLLNTAQQPVLQFAGEATELHHFATVHGAVETGWREANRLIDLYKTI